MKLMKCDRISRMFNPPRLIPVPRDRSTFNSLINPDPCVSLNEEMKNIKPQPRQRGSNSRYSSRKRKFPGGEADIEGGGRRR